MTLFWYIRTITQYVLVCTGLYYYTFPVLVCTQYVLVRTGSEQVHTKYRDPVPVMHLTIPDVDIHGISLDIPCISTKYHLEPCHDVDIYVLYPISIYADIGIMKR